MASAGDAPASRTGMPTTRCGSARELELGGRPYEGSRASSGTKTASSTPTTGLLTRVRLTVEPLAGVDRESFHMMFSLDDESLEKGGEAILASRGDLGQLLFSASAGLAEISDRLELAAQEGGRVLQAARIDNRACRIEA